MVTGETLLLATGLLNLPERRHITAARVVEKDLRDQAADVLDLKDPRPVLRPGVGKTYYQRVVGKEFDYAKAQEFLESQVGDEVAADYQLCHQRAADAIEKRHPSFSMTTIRGPIPLELDEHSQLSFNYEASQVEQMRIMKDWASGALLREWVAMFLTCFPQTYRELVLHINQTIDRKPKGWFPSMFIEDGYRTLTGQTWDTPVTMRGPILPPEKSVEPEQTSEAPARKGGFNPENLQTPAQKASK